MCRKVKKLQNLMILKLKILNINFTAIKVLFWEDVDIDNALVSNKISAVKKQP